MFSNRGGEKEALKSVFFGPEPTPPNIASFGRILRRNMPFVKELSGGHWSLTGIKPCVSLLNNISDARNRA
jgi:hypothetical protein